MSQIKTSTSVHIKESLDSVIYNVSQDETPFVSSIKTESVGSTMFEWTIEERRAASLDNALVEGGELTDTVRTVPVRARNYTQILREVINVSGSMDAANSLNKKESARQIVNAGIDLRKDEEKIMLSAQAAGDGSGGAARRTRGVLNWITSNVVNNATVTEPKFRETATILHTAGAKLKHVYVSPGTKASLTSFTGGATKQQDAHKATVYGATDIYVTDFGTVDIIPSLYVANNVAIFIDPAMFARAQYRKLFKEELAKTSDATRIALVTEVGLISKNEKGSGVLKPTA